MTSRHISPDVVKKIPAQRHPAGLHASVLRGVIANLCSGVEADGEMFETSARFAICARHLRGVVYFAVSVLGLEIYFNNFPVWDFSHIYVSRLAAGIT